MPESRTKVSVAELTTNISIWLAVAAQRQAWMLRDLWTRRGEEYDADKIRHARSELSRHLAERVLNGDHELTRPTQAQELWDGSYIPAGRAVAGDGE